VLVYYRARYYDPTIGRFAQRDPIGFHGGINVYTYVQNNPVNATDPLGLWSASIEAYLGIGGGLNIAYSKGTFEMTSRLGVGYGGGLAFDPKGGPSPHAQSVGSGYIAQTFDQVSAELGVGVVGVGGVATYRSGNAVTTPVGGDYGEVSGTNFSTPIEGGKPFTPNFGLHFGASTGVEIGSYSNWGSLSDPSTLVQVQQLPRSFPQAHLLVPTA
jgi:uncharacterized protein RhaS with RHS repeats